MKQGTLWIRLVMGVLALALCCYFAAFLWNGLSDPYTTTYAYAYQAVDSVSADGFLVREELVLPSQSGIVDVSRGEGEKVGVGQVVALVHRDSQSVQLQQAMEEISMEISILDDAMAQEEDAMSSARLDQSILEAMVELRFHSAQKNYTALESQVLSLKSQIIRREYTYDQDNSLEDLSAQRQALSEQLRALRSQTSGSTSAVTAPAAGVYCTEVDGYEAVLRPGDLEGITPSQLDALSPQAVPSGSPGKLITQEIWYFVCALPAQQAQRCEEGRKLTVRLSGDLSLELTMSVERVGQEEAGRCVLVLSSDRYLAQTALLRRQSLELVFSQSEGLRVPKSAVRMLEEKKTEPKEGQEEQAEPEEEEPQTTQRRDAPLGVYVLVGGKAEFKAVNIITEGEDYFVVSSVRQDSRGLRAGDEIIVNATKLFEGKLLEN